MMTPPLPAPPPVAPICDRPAVRVRLGVVLGAGPLAPFEAANGPRSPLSLRKPLPGGRF